MNKILEEARREYEKRYGQTIPAESDFIFPHRNTENMFLGAEFTATGIIFKFNYLPVISSAFSTIEHHFRNRLMRKISFQSGDGNIEIYFSEWPEEYSEFMIAATDLVRYFNCQPPSLRLVAERNLYIKKQDWRNPELVQAEIARIHSSQNCGND